MGGALSGTQIEAVKHHTTGLLAAELAVAAELDDPDGLDTIFVDDQAVQLVALASKFSHRSLLTRP